MLIGRMTVVNATQVNKIRTEKRMKNIDAFFLIWYIYKGVSKEKWNYVNDFFFGIIGTEIGIAILILEFLILLMSCTGCFNEGQITS